jgi:hemerythrin-like domain-containing protein
MRSLQQLVEAKNRYLDGSDEAQGIIRDSLALLAEFYPKHIEKEDKVFFSQHREIFYP